MFIIESLLSVLFISQAIHARSYTPCELHNELLNFHNLTEKESRNLTCVAQKYSGLNTNIIAGNNYGIFQISKNWCGQEKVGGECNLKCTDLLDNDITDDISCAQIIFRKLGKRAWRLNKKAGCREQFEYLDENCQKGDLINDDNFQVQQDFCESARKLMTLYDISKIDAMIWSCIAEYNKTGIFKLQREDENERGSDDSCVKTRDVLCAIKNHKQTGISGFANWPGYNSHCKNISKSLCFDLPDGKSYDKNIVREEVENIKNFLNTESSTTTTSQKPKRAFTTSTEISIIEEDGNDGKITQYQFSNTDITTPSSSESQQTTEFLSNTLEKPSDSEKSTIEGYSKVRIMFADKDLAETTEALETTTISSNELIISNSVSQSTTDHALVDHTTDEIVLKFFEAIDKCTLAKDMSDSGHIPDNLIPTFVCIAEHESGLNVSFIESDGLQSKYGLFQIDNQIYCSSNDHINQCDVLCAHLVDDQFDNDFECVRHIYKKEGLTYWPSYEKSCKNIKANSLDYCYEKHTTSHRPFTILNKDAELNNIQLTESTTVASSTNDFSQTDINVNDSVPSEDVLDFCEFSHQIFVNETVDLNVLVNYVCIADQSSHLIKPKGLSINDEKIGIFGLKNNTCGKDEASGTCSLLCSDLLDDDLTNDVKCMIKVYNEYGLKEWNIDEKNCRVYKSKILQCVDDNKFPLPGDEDEETPEFIPDLKSNDNSNLENQGQSKVSEKIIDSKEEAGNDSFGNTEKSNEDENPTTNFERIQEEELTTIRSAFNRIISKIQEENQKDEFRAQNLMKNDTNLEQSDEENEFLEEMKTTIEVVTTTDRIKSDLLVEKDTTLMPEENMKTNQNLIENMRNSIESQTMEENELIGKVKANFEIETTTINLDFDIIDEDTTLTALNHTYSTDNTVDTMKSDQTTEENYQNTIQDSSIKMTEKDNLEHTTNILNLEEITTIESIKNLESEENTSKIMNEKSSTKKIDESTENDHEIENTTKSIEQSMFRNNMNPESSDLSSNIEEIDEVETTLMSFDSTTKSDKFYSDITTISAQDYEEKFTKNLQGYNEQGSFIDSEKNDLEDSTTSSTITETPNKNENDLNTLENATAKIETDTLAPSNDEQELENLISEIESKLGFFENPEMVTVPIDSQIIAEASDESTTKSYNSNVDGDIDSTTRQVSKENDLILDDQSTKASKSHDIFGITEKTNEEDETTTLTESILSTELNEEPTKNNILSNRFNEYTEDDQKVKQTLKSELLNKPDSIESMRVTTTGYENTLNTEMTEDPITKSTTEDLYYTSIREIITEFEKADILNAVKYSKRNQNDSDSEEEMTQENYSDDDSITMEPGEFDSLSTIDDSMNELEFLSTTENLVQDTTSEDPQNSIRILTQDNLSNTTDPESPTSNFLLLDKCALAQYMNDSSFPENLISTFVCIAEHESDLNVSAIKTHKSHKKFGLFQIDDDVYCSTNQKINECDVLCAHLTDNQFDNDLECLRQIYKKEGLDYWPSYEKFCKNVNPHALDYCYEQFTTSHRPFTVATNDVQITKVQSPSTEISHIGDVPVIAELPKYRYTDNELRFILRRFDLCELSRELYSQNVTLDEIPSFLCIADLKSQLKIRVPIQDEEHFGLFAINSQFCGQNKTDGICSINCSELWDENIADDIECLYKIRESNTTDEYNLNGDVCHVYRNKLLECFTENEFQTTEHPKINETDLDSDSKIIDTELSDIIKGIGSKGNFTNQNFEKLSDETTVSVLTFRSKNVEIESDENTTESSEEVTDNDYEIAKDIFDTTTQIQGMMTDINAVTEYVVSTKDGIMVGNLETKSVTSDFNDVTENIEKLLTENLEAQTENLHTEKFVVEEVTQTKAITSDLKDVTENIGKILTDNLEAESENLHTEKLAAEGVTQKLDTTLLEDLETTSVTRDPGTKEQIDKTTSSDEKSETYKEVQQSTEKLPPIEQTTSKIIKTLMSTASTDSTDSVIISGTSKHPQNENFPLIKFNLPREILKDNNLSKQVELLVKTYSYPNILPNNGTLVFNIFNFNIFGENHDINYSIHPASQPTSDEK